MTTPERFRALLAKPWASTFIGLAHIVPQSVMDEGFELERAMVRELLARAVDLRYEVRREARRRRRSLKERRGW